MGRVVSWKEFKSDCKQKGHLAFMAWKRGKLTVSESIDKTDMTGRQAWEWSQKKAGEARRQGCGFSCHTTLDGYTVSCNLYK